MPCCKSRREKTEHNKYMEVKKMYKLFDFTIIALKKCIEVSEYTVSAPNVYIAIDEAENYFRANNVVYDEVVSR